VGNLIERGRAAYAQRAWADAREALAAAGALEADDLERLAWASLLSGDGTGCIEALEKLHQARVDLGEPLAAARALFWGAMRLMSLGEPARASGWFSRAQRLIEREQQPCREQGYMRLQNALRLNASGDFVGSFTAAHQAAEFGDRFHDPDLSALARSVEGWAMIRNGQLLDGLPLLDEAMVAVTSDHLSPMVTGIIYCSVIRSCQQSYALDRAREWTSALGHWCDSQPQLVPFAGACLVHRSEVLQLSGRWPDAFEEAKRASEALASTKDSDRGKAAYQEGELHRLGGAFDEAEAAYARASELGKDPQPGLALLRLMQGKVEQAAAATRRALAATTEALARAQILPEHVEVMLAAGDIDEAKRAADELAALAKTFRVEILGALARAAEGAVLLAQGNAKGALEPLRQAHEVWQRAKAPYPTAKTRVLIARACTALGDTDGATLELEAAKRIFQDLGAAPDLAALGATAAPASAQGGHGLSARELEVLLLVAAGKTNRVIGKELFLSERTVDRHVSNIFAKLNVSSRAAATAWAYEHKLVG
jgi:DNA-binding CsgD family transcriptional regulator